jgi:hypothetical protein
MEIIRFEHKIDQDITFDNKEIRRCLSGYVEQVGRCSKRPEGTAV